MRSRKRAGAGHGAHPRRIRRPAHRGALPQRPGCAKLHRAGRRRQAGVRADGRGQRRMRRIGGKCACSSPASSRRRWCVSDPTARSQGFTRRVPETYIRDGGTKALDAAVALDLARTRAHDDWHVDFGPYHLLEQSQETLTDRPRRSPIRVRTRRTVRRRQHPPAGHGHRRRIDRRRTLCARAGEIRPPLRGAAQREQHHRQIRESGSRRAVRHRRMHPRRALAAAPTLAVVAAGPGGGRRRRRPDGVDRAGVRARRMVRLRYRGNEWHLLGAAGRHGDAGAASAARSATASCSWRRRA